jgi:hypothetical protein
MIRCVGVGGSWNEDLVRLGGKRSEVERGGDVVSEDKNPRGVRWAVSGNLRLHRSGGVRIGEETGGENAGGSSAN